MQTLIFTGREIRQCLAAVAIFALLLSLSQGIFIGMADAARTPEVPSGTVSANTQIDVCHNNNGASDYSVVQSKASAIVEETNAGHPPDASHGGDIIPPFDYDFGEGVSGSYPGRNWSEEDTFLNGCVVPEPDPEIDLEVTKVADDDTPDEGQTVVYTITVTNNGPDDATNVVVTDNVPAGTTFDSSNPSEDSTGPLTWNIGDLASGDSEIIEVTVTVDADTAGDVIVNTASASADESAFDSNSGNDSVDEDITVNIPTPTDVCPNIDGIQETVPDGYEVDTNGDCVEIPTDVCPNIDGVQTEVPDGYEVDTNGDCVEIDVCPNIDGAQTTVPDGYYVDTSGDCVEIPDDACPNIDGVQETVPDGYGIDGSGNCVLLGSMTINKVVNDEAGDTTEFDFSVDGSIDSYDGVFTLMGGENINRTDILPGSYAFTEGAEEGWTLNKIACTAEGNSTFSTTTDSVTITFAEGDTVSCSFHNHIVETPTDVCPNIDGIQETVPEGYEVDTNGDCVEIPTDVCPNIDGTQTTVPNGYYIDTYGDCVPEDNGGGPDTCEATFYSDTSNYVVEKDANAVALTYIHQNWTANIPGATWIWGDDPVVDPTVDETQTFVQQFGWVGAVTSATLTIGTDNGHIATLNDGTDNVGGSTFGSAVVYDVTADVQQGDNEIAIAVTNTGIANSDYLGNPAGLLYALTIEGEVTTDDDCVVPFVGEEDLYRVEGYVWHDDNENSIWDGFDNEESEEEFQESEVLIEDDLSGWTVRITNGEVSYATTTDENGYYYFEVPAGTWTISEDTEEGWKITTPVDNQHVVTVPAVVTQTFFEQLFALVIPTAHAAVVDTFGLFNFGNNESSTGGGGSSSGGGGGGGSATRPQCDAFSVHQDAGLQSLSWETSRGTSLSITENGTEIYNTSDASKVDMGVLIITPGGDTIYELTVNRGSRSDACRVALDTPAGQVLGEQVSVVPAGAPDAGAGGTSPVQIPRLPLMLAMLGGLRTRNAK